MTLSLKWKIIIPVVVILALIAGYLQIKNAKQNITEETPINFQEQQEQAQKQQEQNTTIPEVVLPVATGNIDDTVNALLQDSSSETGILQEEMADADIIADDSQAISDFGQSYNENEF